MSERRGRIALLTSAAIVASCRQAGIYSGLAAAMAQIARNDMQTERVREQVQLHLDEYDRLMTEPSTRQKRGGRSYTSPYYPENCKARKAKR